MFFISLVPIPNPLYKIEKYRYRISEVPWNLKLTKIKQGVGTIPIRSQHFFKACLTLFLQLQPVKFCVLTERVSNWGQGTGYPILATVSADVSLPG